MGRRDASGLLASFQEQYDDLLRYLARRTGDMERVADIAPDSAIIENNRAYIYRVAGNLAVDTMRREGRHTAWLTGDEPDEGIVDRAPSPERIAIGRDHLGRLEEALEALPPKARLALLMFRIDGFPMPRSPTA